MPATSKTHTHNGRHELAFFAGVYGLYLAARWVLVGELSVARDNAHWIYQLEQTGGFAVEGAVQDALSGSTATFLLSNIYMAAQMVVLPAGLVFVYRKAPAVYGTLRTTVIGAWLIAIPIYALFPVAPPRLAGLGFVDTVSEQAGVALTGRSTLLYNPYAAVPSLHVGLAFAIGIGIAASVRSRPLRAAALAWGPIVTLSVVATGNHYIFDAAAGLVVTGTAYAIARVPHERLRRLESAFAHDVLRLIYAVRRRPTGVVRSG